MKFAIVLLFLGTAVLHAEEPSEAVKKDLELLQGSYTAESIQMGEGPGLKPEALKSFPLKIEGDSWTLGNSLRTKIKLDPTQNPKHLDMLVDIGGEKPRLIRCIYEYKDDTLTVGRAYQQVDGERPTKFEAKGIFGVAVYKKVKPEK